MTSLASKQNIHGQSRPKTVFAQLLYLRTSVSLFLVTLFNYIHLQLIVGKPNSKSAHERWGHGADELTLTLNVVGGIQICNLQVVIPMSQPLRFSLPTPPQDKPTNISQHWIRVLIKNYTNHSKNITLQMDKSEEFSNRRGI